MTDFIRRRFRRWLGTLTQSNIGDGTGHADSTFFTRYDLLKTRWGSLYLHEFFRSDHDRCLHDHPWKFATLILRGGYWETMPIARGGIRAPTILGPDYETVLMPTERVWRRPGYFGVYPASHAHQIELEPGRRLPWSLVWAWPKTRRWGFWGKNGWIPWRPDDPNPICETR